MLLYIPYAGWPLVMEMENGDDASRILLPWLPLQLQVTTVPRNPLVSANGVQLQLPSQGHAAGDAGSYYTTLGFW